MSSKGRSSCSAAGKKAVKVSSSCRRRRSGSKPSKASLAKSTRGGCTPADKYYHVKSYTKCASKTHQKPKRKPRTKVAKRPYMTKEDYQLMAEWSGIPERILRRTKHVQRNAASYTEDDSDSSDGGEWGGLMDDEDLWNGLMGGDDEFSSSSDSDDDSSSSSDSDDDERVPASTPVRSREDSFVPDVIVRKLQPHQNHGDSNVWKEGPALYFEYNGEEYAIAVYARTTPRFVYVFKSGAPEPLLLMITSQEVVIWDEDGTIYIKKPVLGVHALPFSKIARGFERGRITFGGDWQK